MPVRVIRRDSWSKTGFILASIGAAVGVGNIWRFPYMVGINGGGAFLIPYLVGVVLFSLPLMVLELDAGRHFRGSVLSVMGRVSRRYRSAGMLPLAISMGVAGYYLVVTGWSLAYFTFSLSCYVPFGEFTSSMLPLVFFLVSLAMTSLIVSLGIKRGIERASIVLMPAFAILLVSLAAYSLTLPGAGEGVSFYLIPDFSYLYDMNIWVMGIVQSFFSLAVGYGILITYASYLPENQKVARYAVGIAGADTLIALVGGLIVFPIVFSFGLDPATGSGLTFLSLPLVFQSIPLGFLVGAAFFLLLFVAGLTSAVGFFEVGSSSLVDRLSWSRRKSSLVLSVVISFVGIPTAMTSYGQGLSVLGIPLLEFLDMAFGRLLLLSAAVMSLLIARHYRPQPLSGDGLLSRIVLLSLKYLIPLALIAIFTSLVLQ